MFSPLPLSFYVLNVGRLIPIATTALAVIVANRRQHIQVGGALPERQARERGTYAREATYEGFLGGDSPRVH